MASPQSLKVSHYFRLIIIIIALPRRSPTMTTHPHYHLGCSLSLLSLGQFMEITSSANRVRLEISKCLLPFLCSSVHSENQWQFSGTMTCPGNDYLIRRPLPLWTLLCSVVVVQNNRRHRRPPHWLDGDAEQKQKRARRVSVWEINVDLCHTKRWM